MKDRLRNIGPKSAAWLRQVGIHERVQLERLGAASAYLKVRHAGFRPGLNLLYALEGALTDRHWQQVAPQRRAELAATVSAADTDAGDASARRRGGPVKLTYGRRGGPSCD